MNEKDRRPGRFIISLDVELLWGLWDIKTKDQYGRHIQGAREVFPKILDLFQRFNIQATFAVVGSLFAADKQELMSFLPSTQPKSTNLQSDAYAYLSNHVGHSESEDPYHFGTTLIETLLNYPQHEIASHTFFHNYCFESTYSPKEFKLDLQAAVNAAKKYKVNYQSLIFPRNQYNAQYLKVMTEMKIQIFRGTENGWMYDYEEKNRHKVFVQRVLRLLDTYFNLSGHHCFELPMATEQGLVNLPSSRFLRPYLSKLRFLETLKLNRVLNSMTYAAKAGLVFHLWWHPHNFGLQQEENLKSLLKILQHYQYLNQEYDFKSQTMAALGNEILGIDELK